MNEPTDQRLASAYNAHQGPFKRVLCVCTSGCLRSPTAAHVLSNEPFNYNTRACGIEPEYALIPLDIVLLEWADEIIVFDFLARHEIGELLLLHDLMDRPIINLEIPDEYDYRDPELVHAITQNYLNMR